MFSNCRRIKIIRLYPDKETDTRTADGTVKLRNPHINEMPADILYHLSLGTDTHNLQEMFGDVKFVCMGGTPKRMESFAYFILEELGQKLPTGTQLIDISHKSYRYSLYKVGPVISVSHGMGMPSLSILLHELIKLMYHAKAKDPLFFRLGTCGGLGLEPGTVVISDRVVDGLLNPDHQVAMLGKIVSRPCSFDKTLIKQLLQTADVNSDGYNTVQGATMSTNDFYEGQGRLDGAFCDYTEKDKLGFLEKLKENGIVNIEMEALAFGALCHHAGIKAAVICVTLLDRLNGDQITQPKTVLEDWQRRPQHLVAKYIKQCLDSV